MIPGTTTKLSEETLASAATILPKADLVKVTGTTAIETITPQFGGGFSGILILVPVDGDVDVATTGNVAVAVTCAQNRATVFVFSKEEAVWYPGAIS